MPKIERDIPYTFSAYSGGGPKPLAGGQRACAAGVEKEGKEEEEEEEAERKGKADEEHPDCDKRGEKGDFKDVYNFDEEDEEDEFNETKEPVCSISRQKSAVASRKSTAAALPVPCHSPLKTGANESGRSNLLDGRNSGSEAGLLVMAALTAAENDIMGEKGDALNCAKGEGAKWDDALDEDVGKKGNKKKESDGDSEFSRPSQDTIPGPPSKTSSASTLSHSAQSLLNERPGSARTPPRDQNNRRAEDDVSIKNGGESRITDSPRAHPSATAAAVTGSAPSAKGPPPQPQPPPPPNPSPYLSSFPSEPYPLYPTALDIAATNYPAPTPHHHPHPHHLHHPHHGGLRSVTDYPPRSGYPPPHHHPQPTGVSIAAADFQPVDHLPPAQNNSFRQSGSGGEFAPLPPHHPHPHHLQIDAYPSPLPPKDAAAAAAQFGYAASASYHHHPATAAAAAAAGYPQLSYPGPPHPSPSSPSVGAPGSSRVPPPTSNSGPLPSPGAPGNTYNHYYF